MYARSYSPNDNRCSDFEPHVFTWTTIGKSGMTALLETVALLLHLLSGNIKQEHHMYVYCNALTWALASAEDVHLSSDHRKCH